MQLGSQFAQRSGLVFREIIYSSRLHADASPLGGRSALRDRTRAKGIRPLRTGSCAT
jgi:hypothetical protein